MKKIYFSVREYPEVLALSAIMARCTEMKMTDLEWHVFCSPVNTDFKFLSLKNSFARTGTNVNLVDTSEIERVDKSLIFGFETDMRHPQDTLVGHFFNIFDIMTTRLYRRRPIKIWNETPILVLGNVKIELPIEEFQQEIFARLAELPYRVIIVPRHPLENELLASIRISSKLHFINTMGDLERLHAHADSVIMGRIFCKGDLISTDDHNPLEATINACALAGITTNIPRAYEWIYYESGLIHQCKSYDEVFELLPIVINDTNVVKKLKRKKEWILANRERIFGPILEILSA